MRRAKIAERQRFAAEVAARDASRGRPRMTRSLPVREAADAPYRSDAERARMRRWWLERFSRDECVAMGQAFIR